MMIFILLFLKLAQETCNVAGCEQCVAGDPDKCLTCNSNGHFVSDGADGCKCDEENGYVSGGSNDCVLKETCNVAGCEQCVAGDPDKCLTCNSNGHFVSDGADGCKCDEENGFISQNDGSCKKLDEPILDCSSISGCEKCEKNTNSDKLICTQCQDGEKPTELNTCPLAFAEESYEQIEIGESGCISEENVLTISPDETLKGDNPSVTIDSDSKIEKIIIKDANTKILMLNLPEDSNILIEPPTGGKNNVIVNLANGVTLTLPEASQKVDIVGNKNVKLVPSVAEKPININKIRFDASHKLEKIESDSNLNINEMDIFGEQKFEGNDKMKCINLKVEKGATFNPQKISFENARVGLESVLNIDSPVNIDHYLVAFNNANPQHIPIRFSGSKPNLNGKDIQLFKQNSESELLEEKKTNLASFQGDNAKESCNDLEFKENKDVDMKSAKCEESQNGQFNLVASSKGKSKDGLGPGPIAGIVIACVVVVAAIIALIVYFLVIKKKNETTASTEGDSSIAI